MSCLNQHRTPNQHRTESSGGAKSGLRLSAPEISARTAAIRNCWSDTERRRRAIEARRSTRSLLCAVLKPTAELLG